MAKSQEFYDRTDAKKWAHPALADTWDLAGTTEAFDEILDPAISFDKADALRERLEETITELIKSFPQRPEVVAAGTSSWVNIPIPGDIESDAPTLPIVVRTPTPRIAERVPVLFFVSGGGLALSNPLIEEMVFNEHAYELGAVVVAAKYRVAPRWQYPAAVNDLQAAFTWMVNNAEELGIDLDKIVMMGGSSGAHLTAALTHRFKRIGYPSGVRPRAQILQDPVVEDRQFMQSRRIQSPSWTPASEATGWKCWLGENYNRIDLSPEAVPGHAEGDDFEGLPPAFIHCMEHDHGRDDTVRYAQGLLDAGVFCELHVWGGFHHTSAIAATAEPVVRFKNMVAAQLKEALTYDLRRE